ncbi:MAG TPA: hypothetical protein VEH62_12800, partial [Gemmatimonadales bacterium]|nr:hypothetical protein [Gemmatimonadales bacterium]
VWGNTCGYPPCGLNDVATVPQLYRVLSGQPQAALGDGSCTPNAAARTCNAIQAAGDTRYFESTGPVDLAPGQSMVIAMAMVYAAPLAQWAATTNGIYAMPAGQLAPYLPQGAFVPGYPASPDTLALVGTAGGGRVCTTACGASATIREPIERAMGWGQFSDANGDGRIEPGEVTTVPGSLLNKAQAAQALFDRKFVMPAAPVAPAFFLIPGDSQVTVAWQKSATETVGPGGGDPYFLVASDPTSALYDPDFRQYDVVGYRIWRGTSPSSLQLLAEFDYSGLTFADYTGQIDDPYVYGNRCAPELGLTASCPAFPVAYPIPGQVGLGAGVVQVPLGGRVLLQNGTIAVLQADTVHFYTAPYVDYQVPFVFTDATARNGFLYYYAVTAFDLNSDRSGPPTLESPLAPKAVTPRVGSGQELAGALGATQLLGADGSVLAGTMPSLDRTTGEFSGPMPPADGLGLALVGFAPQLVDSGSVTVTIDSVVPGDAWNGQPGAYFYTTQTRLGTTHTSARALMDSTSATGVDSVTLPVQHAIQARASRFGGDSTFVIQGALTLQWPGTWDLTNWGRASANSYPSGNFGYNGPRWWVGTANENTPNPNGGMCIPGNRSCSSAYVYNLANTAGSLGAGVQVMAIQGYSTVPGIPLRQVHALAAILARAADFKVYWGSGLAVDSVVDVTHHVRVPFSPVLRASWGILNDSSFVGTNPALTPDGNNGVLTWQDVFCIAPVPALEGFCGGVGQTPAVLMSHARLSPVVFGSSAYGVPAPGATGSGFIFYIAGQFFLMQVTSAPAPGTVWNLRTYTGNIINGPGFFQLLTSCNYAYHCYRPAAVPGLRARISYTGSVLNPAVTTAAELAAVHTVPDPFYNHSDYETPGGPRQIRFVHLPAQCVIRIYSASGILVTLLTHNDPTGGGEEPWDVTNRGGRLVASGVYFWHVITPDGRQKVGRMTVVNVTAN